MKTYERLATLKFAVSALALGVALESGSAFAQTATAAGAVEEVVVTSRLKSEKLLDVPLSITAFTPAVIEARQIKDLHDIAAYTPGFAFNNASTTGNTRQSQTLIMRGMNPPTGTGAYLFVDGAPITSGVLEGFSDVERMEVLKGPQSAYFGRSTFSGAISVITQKPSLTRVEGKVSADYSSYNTADVMGSVSAPIIADKLAARIAAHYYTTDGQYDNTAGNALDGTNNRLGARQTESIAFTLYARPTDKLTISATTNYFQFRDGPSTLYSLKYDQANCKAIATSPLNNWFCGTVPGPIPSKIGYDAFIDAGYTASLVNDNKKIGNLFGSNSFLDKPGLARNVFEQSINATYDFGSLMKATVVAAYHNDDYIVINDQDQYASTNVPNSAAAIAVGNRPYVNYLLRVDQKNEDHYFEGRLNSTWTSPFQWLIGASEYDLDTAGKVNGDGPTGYVSYGSTSINRIKTTGVFGSLSYHFLDKFDASFDGRYQWDDVQTSNALPQTIFRQATFTSFQPRVILKYQVDPTFNVYASVSQGNRPGGFNLFSGGSPSQIAYVKQVSGALDNFLEEKVTMYELGSKGRILDGRFTYAADIYYGVWDNQQVSEAITLVPYVVPNIINTTLNIGQTKLSGAEFEGRYVATEALSFDASFAYTKATVYHFYCTECLSTNGNPNVDGNQIRRVPFYSASLGAEYRRRIDADKSWFFRADDVFRSSSSPIEDNLAQTGNRNILNLRVGIEDVKWRVELYGTNVLNDTHFLDLVRNTDLLSLSGGKATGNNSILGTLAEKPTVGVRASYKY